MKWRRPFFLSEFISQFLSSPWVEQILFDIGQYYFGKKEYANAANTFRQFLRTYHESDLREWVHFMLGESLFNLKDYSGAIASYHQVLEEKGRAVLEPQVFSKLGYTYFYLKNYEMAIQYWERLLAAFPNLAEKNEVFYWMAEASILKQDYKKGVGYVDKLRGDPTLYPKALNGLGWYHFQRREWKEANQYFLKFLKEFPQYRSTPSISLLVGECYLNQNDYQKAKSYLTRLSSMTEENGDKDKATYLLGWVAYREERFDEAIHHFKPSWNRTPERL
jgi:TolA-binding protein